MLSVSLQTSYISVLAQSAHSAHTHIRGNHRAVHTLAHASGCMDIVTCTHIPSRSPSCTCTLQAYSRCEYAQCTCVGVRFFILFSRFSFFLLLMKNFTIHRECNEKIKFYVSGKSVILESDLVEAVRCIAELVVWGDQNDEKMFL